VAGLSDKQKRFVDEYLIDLNATQAAIRAGYSPKTAQEQSSRLLSNVMIQALIQERRLEAQKRNEITLDRVIQEMAKVAFSDLRKVLGPEGVLLDPSEWDDDTAGAIASLEVVAVPSGKDAEGNTTIERVHKIKVWDKMAALDKLGKHLGLADRSAEKQTDRLAQAIQEISARGSAAPIATARRAQMRDDEDEE
jgi:phage terminase small subunit